MGSGGNIGLMRSAINTWVYVCNKSSGNKLKDNFNVEYEVFGGRRLIPTIKANELTWFKYL